MIADGKLIFRHNHVFAQPSLYLFFKDTVSPPPHNMGPDCSNLAARRCTPMQFFPRILAEISCRVLPFKSEARNPKQIQSTNVKKHANQQGFWHLRFGFMICFEFRALDFRFREIRQLIETRLLKPFFTARQLVRKLAKGKPGISLQQHQLPVTLRLAGKIFLVFWFSVFLSPCRINQAALVESFETPEPSWRLAESDCGVRLTSPETIGA